METPETGTFGTEEAAPAVEAAVTEEFDAHFDDAMAEVDMDFDLPAEPEVTPGPRRPIRSARLSRWIWAMPSLTPGPKSRRRR